MANKHTFRVITNLLMATNTCGEVEHVEIWRKVVSDVPSGQMVQVGLMKELPSIPDKKGEDY